MRSQRSTMILVAAGVSTLALLYSLWGPYVPASSGNDAAIYAQATALLQPEGASGSSTTAVILSLLMRAGASFAVASSILPALIILAMTCLLVSSQVPPALMAGLLLGSFVSVYIWSDAPLSAAPVSATLAALTALAACETARVSDWRQWRCFAAGAFTALAAALAPWTFGIAATTGIYAILSFRTATRGRAIAVAAWMFAGALCVVVAMLAIGGDAWVASVADNFAEVLQSASPAAFSDRVHTHTSLLQQTADDLRFRTAAGALLWPVLKLSMPIAVWAVAGLLLPKVSRPLALASLPLLATLAFVPLRMTGNAGFIPEVALYLAASVTLLITGLTALTTSLDPSGARRGVALVVAIVVVSVVEAIPRSMGKQWDFAGGSIAAELERSAMRDLLGDPASASIVDSSMWYRSGGRSVRSVAQRLTARPDDLAGLLGDGALLLTERDLTRSRTASLIAAWFEHRLTLRGLVMAHPDAREDARLSLVLRENDSVAFQAWVLNSDRISRFVSEPDGPSLLVLSVCPRWITAAEPGLKVFEVRTPIQQRPSDDSVLAITLGERVAVASTVRQRQRPCVEVGRYVGALLDAPASIFAEHAYNLPMVMTSADVDEGAAGR